MSNTNPLPAPQKFLCWRVPIKDENGQTFLIVPRSDPYEHEHPMDLLFENEAQALESLDLYEAQDEAKEEGWLLCESVVTPVRRAP